MEKLESYIKYQFEIHCPNAELRLLIPDDKEKNKEWQLYVLTKNRTDVTMEKKLLDACYKVELQTGISLCMFVYTLKDWEKHFRKTPIYSKVMHSAILI